MILHFVGSGRESARLTQTPQHLVIVLSDGWSFGGHDLDNTVNLERTVYGKN
jgi:hypothetical protein